MFYKYSRILSILFLFISSIKENSFAQANSLVSRIIFLKTDFDTAFIQTAKAKWQLNLYLATKGNNFTNNAEGTNEVVDFYPASSFSIGGGGSYKNFGLSYGFNLTSTKTDSGKLSRGLSFLSSVYAGQHVFDFGFQATSGYFATGYNKIEMQQQTLYKNDLTNISLFLNYLYNFNYKKFSFNAAFTGSQKQMKSAGGPLAGIFLSYFDLHANDAIVPLQFVDSFTNKNQISEANILSTGLLAGYAYTFVLPGKFYITLSLAPGLAFNVGEVKSDVYYNIGNPFTVSYKLISREALGHDAGKRFYTYIAFFSDTTWLALNNNDSKETFNNHSGTFKWLVGFRFN